MNKIFSFVAASLFAASMWAAVGPQSIQLTFQGTDAEGWAVTSGGAVTSVADGVVNVQMAVQTNEKYRADFVHDGGNTFTFDKAKDIVWAIKLTAPLPGTSNARKFEINYNNAEGAGTWINGISGPSGQIDCMDGGRIYYFDLAAMGKLDAVQEGEVAINKIHFIMADAVCDSAAEAVYAVDWVATFTSVNDLKSFKDWKDNVTDATLPYLELGFRPKADGSSYDSRSNGFKETQLEGNYRARLFAVEYFLVPAFDASKNYTLALTTVGAGGTDSLVVWDFPYQVSYETSAADMIAMATAVVGYVPGATGTMNAPLAEAQCDNSVWTFSVSGNALTPLAVYGDKTLVAFFVTSRNHTADKKGKFASASNDTFAAPSFQLTEDAPTAIDNVNANAKAVKRIINGQLVIIRDGRIYTALGQMTK